MTMVTVSASEIAKQVRGVTYSKGDAIGTPSPGYVMLLRANNITAGGLTTDGAIYVPESKVSPKQRLLPGDIVVATSSGSLDVVGKASPVTTPIDATFGAFCKVVRPNKKVAPEYLAQFFKSAPYRQTVMQLAAGANINNLRNEHIDDLQIPIPHKNGKPDLEEQKRIAAILDKADGIRRKRQQALRLTDDFLRSVFLDMFGDPVTNPMGWDLLPISSGIESFDGGKNVAPLNTPRSDGMRVLKVSAVTSGEFLEHESKSFSEDFQVPTDYIVKQGDLLISRANTKELVGAVAYVWKTSAMTMLPDKLWRFVWSEPKRIHPLFMLHMARSSHFRNELMLRATGSSGSMKNIGKVKMLDIPIPLPPYPLQERFAKIAIRLRSQSCTSTSTLREAEDLFSSLQQRAFRGEL